MPMHTKEKMPMHIRVLTIIAIAPIFIFVLFLGADQYAKYAMKTATIKLVKEYCEKDVTIRDVRIAYFSFYAPTYSFFVYTDPPEYGVSGDWDAGYKSNLPYICTDFKYVPLRLSFLKREFIPINKN